MRYLLDANIITNLTTATPAQTLIVWMADQADDELFIASLTLAEIRRAVLEKPPGRQRDRLDAWSAGSQGSPVLFAGRVLPFDEKAGIIWARLMADGEAKGHPRSGLSTIIASIAEANDCVVVTENEQDFENVQVINPTRGSA
jgi:predicted nucleic acid-binding protein